MHVRNIRLLPDRYPTGDVYPFNLDIFRATDRLDLGRPVTFFVGENGTGKSTLLRAIAMKCNIHIWEGLERTRFHYNPHERELHKYIALEWTDGPVPGSFFA